MDVTLSNGTQVSITGQTTNFHSYSDLAYSIASLTLSITSSIPTALCTPEIFVSDAHILYGMAGTTSSAWKRIINLTSNSSVFSSTFVPEVTNNTWLIDSSCYTNTLSSADLKYDVFVKFAADTGDISKLKLVTNFFLITGPDNLNTNITVYTTTATANLTTRTI